MSSHRTPCEIVASLISSIQTSEPTSNTQSSNPLKDAPQHIQKALLTLHVLFPNELLPALDLHDRGLVTRLKLHDEGTQQRQPPNDGSSQTQRAVLVPPTGVPTVPIQQNLRRQHGELRHLPNDLQALQRLRREDPVQVEGAEAVSQAARHQEPHDLDDQSLGGQDQTHRHERSDAGAGAAVTNDTRRAAVSTVYSVRSGQLPSRVRVQNVVNHTASYEVRLDAWNCSCPVFAFSTFPASASEEGILSLDTSEEDTHRSNASWKFGGLTLGSDMPVCKHLLACVLVEHSGFFSSFVEEREVSVEELAGLAAGWGD